ncbi:MAG: OmpA family protein, partial [Rudanella sp.]|nr:OmpA family protein [Rudanella sp.]
IAVHYEVSRRFDVGLDFRVNHVNTERLDATIGGVTSSVFDRTGSRGSFDGTDLKQGESAKDKFGYGAIVLTYKLGAAPARVRKENNKFQYDNRAGKYHLRWTDPKLFEKPPVVVSMAQIDSVAKANRPGDIDPRLIMDTDRDGVSDYFDKQPQTPSGSVVSGSGESIDFDQYVTVALPQMACAEIFANIQFDTDKAEVKPQYYETLDRVVALMNKTQCRLQLSGHADQRASDRYNMALSRRRVEAVRQYMIRAGLTEPSRLLTDYFGALKPIDDDSPTGLFRNRRVELKLIP